MMYVDITELANWQGKHTGVPRVMYELCSRFASEDAEIQFIVWDGSEHSYHSINISLVLNGQEDARHGDNQINDFDNSTTKTYTSIKTLIKKSATLTKAATFIKKNTKQRKTTSPKRDLRVDSLQFKKDDVIFVLCDWHGSDQVFIDTLILLHQKGVKLAHMAYDILPIVTPQYSGHGTASLTKYSKAIYPLCEIMFSISKHTKQDIADWLSKNNLRVPNIEVVRLGDDFQFTKSVKPRDSFFERKSEFILCVGTIEARKNHTLLYYTYKLAKQKGVELPPIVIVGRRGWQTENIYELITQDPEVKAKFLIQENISDEELSWLYENCVFSVYPSFYEGWGLPIAESVSRGVPCVCSNTSSMPEIAGDLISYFTPFSAEECLVAIRTILKPGALKEAQQKLGNYKQTSWDETFLSVHNQLSKINE